MSVIEMLRGHDLFQSLTVEEVEHINSFSSVKSLEEGETVFEQDSRGSHVFILLTGRVHLTLPATVENLNLIVTAVEKDEFFGLSPLLGSEIYTATARCVEPSTVMAIEAAPFREVLERDHLVGIRVMSMVARVYYSRYIDTFNRVQKILQHVPLTP